MWLRIANLSGSHANPSMHMCIHHQLNHNCALLGGSKPQEAAQDAASAVKSAVPAEPKEAAKDAVNAAKDSLPEPPKDIPNALQNLFGELIETILLFVLEHLNKYGVRIAGTPITITACPRPVVALQGLLLYMRLSDASIW